MKVGKSLVSLGGVVCSWFPPPPFVALSYYRKSAYQLAYNLQHYVWNSDPYK